MIHESPIFDFDERSQHSIGVATARRLDDAFAQGVRESVDAARASTAQRDEADYGVFLGVMPSPTDSDQAPQV